MGVGSRTIARVASSTFAPLLSVAAMACAAPALAAEPIGPLILANQVPPDIAPDSLSSPQTLREIEIQPRVLELVAELDSETFEQRERAAHALVELDVPEVQLHAVLEQRPLSAEQRHRMLSIARERVVNAPRGALGIRMQAPNVGDPRGLNHVTIAELIPGLPAAEVLRVGDTITHINETVLNNMEDLVVMVQARRPGEVVHLTVLRDKRDEAGRPVLDDNDLPLRETHEIPVALGSVEGLQDPRTGALPAPTRVEMERRREVFELEQRYAPRAREIRMIRWRR